MKPKLFIITATFPFGTKSETFLESEIFEIAEYFKEIVILPVSKDDGTNSLSQRSIPSNAFVDESLIQIDKNTKQILSSHLIYNALKILCYEFLNLTYGREIFVRRIKWFWNHLKKDLRYYQPIKEILVKSNSKFIVYNYWFVKTSISIALLRKKKIIKTSVSRAHGYDLYNDRWQYGLLPFRNYIATHFDSIYPVSQFGKKYLLNNLSKHFKKSKVKVSYLGVDPIDLVNNSKKDYEKLIVSVSSVIDFKRVHKIQDILSKIDLPIKWVHFGDGPYMDLLKESVKNASSNLKVELKGHLPNKEVLNFYQNENVDLHLSLSLNEGLPVSIMEAISYGIPVVAMDIKAMKEIVNDKTGRLIPEKSNDLEIAKFVKEALIVNFERNQISQFQKTNFNSRTNYKNFAESIIKNISTD